MKPEKTSQGLWAVAIAGRNFEFQKWGAEEQTDTLIDLMAVVGPVLGSLTSIYRQADSLDDEIGESVMQKLVGALSTGLSRDKAMSKRLMRKLSSDRILCEGRAIAYDTFYQDDLMLAFQVIKASLDVQYANFFVAAGSLLPKRTQVAASSTAQK